MTRLLLVLTIIGLIIIGAGSVWAVDHVRTMPMPVKGLNLTGDEPVGPVQYVPSTPRTICSPGDTMGFTQYDYQTNGSTGRRAAVDAAGGVHFDWMCGDPYPSVRNVNTTATRLVLPLPGPSLVRPCHMAVVLDIRKSAL